MPAMSNLDTKVTKYLLKQGYIFHIVDADVGELTAAIKDAFYDGNNNVALVLCKELLQRIELTSI